MKYRKLLLRVAVCLLAIAATFSSTSLWAQSAEKFSAKHIPADAIVAGFFSPVKFWLHRSGN